SGEDSALEGFWGGGVLEVTATQSALVINQGCYIVTFPGPIRLIPPDSFAIVGTLTASSWRPQVGQPWRAWGSVFADTLRLQFSYRYLGDTTQWLAHNGKPALLVAGH